MDISTTTGSLTCPNCKSPIGVSDAACRTCGADIQLMTLAADRELMSRAVNARETQPLVHPEQLVPRLGDYLVQRGYVTPAQLQAALERQARAGSSQARLLIGETLVAMGAMSGHALDQAIASRLAELQQALLDANRDLEQRIETRTHELQTALARLTEFNQLKANFISNVSHELRTPLTHIKGYNELLREGAFGDLSSEQAGALDVTSRAIERLEQLINDLISYAAAAKGELTLNRRAVVLNGVIEQAVRRSQAKAQRQKVALSYECPPDLPPVLADEEKLLWTLLQLVDNGLKFTPTGGKVIVKAGKEGGQVVTAVCDTGIGIPPGRLDQAFEAFRQLDGSSTRRYGGTGLGLALVQRILDAHGSTMKVESQENKGTIFSFALPRYEAPPD